MSEDSVEMTDADNRVFRRPLLRQLLICSGAWTSYFVFGLLTGAPTVFIPQIRKEANSQDVIDEEMESWLNSVIGFSGFPCVIIATVLTRFIGRKISLLVACVVSLTALILFYCSTTVTQILISEIMQGYFSATQMVVALMVLTEYTSPKFRGLFLTIKSATIFLGIWVANALGTFFDWRSIGIVGIACTLYMAVTILLWPESPYWLASRGKFNECKESHRWLKGCGDESENELDNLIYTQKEYIKSLPKGKQNVIIILKDYYLTITDKQFYKPTFISILTGMLSIFCGKLIFAVYAIDIIKKITDSDSTAYTGMLILGGITVFCMYMGCILIKYINRRILLLVGSSVGVFFLFVMSLYLYLIHLSVISENHYVTLCLFLFYSVSVSCGPLLICIAVYGELIPIKSRNLASCVVALSGKITLATMIKIAPYMFTSFGMHGTFLTFGLLSSGVILLLYKYLPNTKDKTLQEISDSIVGVTRNKETLDEASNILVY